MWQDPIVEEIHRTREKLAAQFDFDIAAIFADLRKRQVALGERLVPQKNKTESMTEVNERSHLTLRARRRPFLDPLP